MREDAYKIIKRTIADCMPDTAVQNALKDFKLSGRVYVAAIGKAAWVMAKAAADFLGNRLEKGVIVTKYEHTKEMLDRFEIIEAGHPTPDENSILGAHKVIKLLEQAAGEDTVLFLLSGGGSALVEVPMEGLLLSDIQKMTKQLLFCGARITEINVIRKKLSAIKGGKLAGYIHGAKAYSIILSDIIGENEDMIASGLTYPDDSTVEDVRCLLEKYKLETDEKVERILLNSSPCKDVCVENHVVGSVKELCQAAAVHAKELGYEPYILTTSMECEAKEAGKWITSKEHRKRSAPFAVIAGGETVVKVTGGGLGGRNQELALYAAKELAGQKDVLLFSIGSDGTDGPTDAAGGIVDGETVYKLKEIGVDVEEALRNHDSYHALQKVNGLVITGPTGTNVNDVTVLLCKNE
ncbi:glycerate kinase [bacterium 1xD42-62]|uniref:Glycerate kinase n=2 Tax=Parablautia muri TaxID=2320879 RepID=A0A9X5BD47_9FIRM|nr:glycerate kinase [Parablautia muri]NBJ91804.1 glycerate kinase [Parablautia muri]